LAGSFALSQCNYKKKDPLYHNRQSSLSRCDSLIIFELLISQQTLLHNLNRRHSPDFINALLIFRFHMIKMFSITYQFKAEFTLMKYQNRFQLLIFTSFL